MIGKIAKFIRKNGRIIPIGEKAGQAGRLIKKAGEKLAKVGAEATESAVKATQRSHGSKAKKLFSKRSDQALSAMGNTNKRLEKLKKLHSKAKRGDHLAVAGGAALVALGAVGAHKQGKKDRAAEDRVSSAQEIKKLKKYGSKKAKKSIGY